MFAALVKLSVAAGQGVSLIYILPVVFMPADFHNYVALYCAHSLIIIIHSGVDPGYLKVYF